MTPEGSSCHSEIAPGHHKEHLVSGGAVLRAEPVDRGTKAPRTRAVEVRNLNNPHDAESELQRVCGQQRDTNR